MNFRRSADVSIGQPRRRESRSRRPDDKGPWFPAQYGGDCGTCGEYFEQDDEIRADGHGGWEARECCGDDDDD